MKKLTIAILLLASTFYANASVEETLQNICKIVAADDKSELRKKLRELQDDHRFRLSDVYDGITCNGKTLIRHADAHGAVDMLDFLTKKITKVQAVMEVESWDGSEVGKSMILERVN